jgi:hypothetical protein
MDQLSYCQAPLPACGYPARELLKFGPELHENGGIPPTPSKQSMAPRRDGGPELLANGCTVDHEGAVCGGQSIRARTG